MIIHALHFATMKTGSSAILALSVVVHIFIFCIYVGSANARRVLVIFIKTPICIVGHSSICRVNIKCISFWVYNFIFCFSALKLKWRRFIAINGLEAYQTVCTYANK